MNEQTRSEYLRMYTCLIEKGTTAGFTVWPGMTSRPVAIPGGGNASEEFMDMRGVFTIGDVRGEVLEWFEVAYDPPKHSRPVVFTDGKDHRVGVYKDFSHSMRGPSSSSAFYGPFCGDAIWAEATHWCPLPKLPEECE